ncbi:MAG: hypothetical protein AMK69_12600 [Nitrospira bacterium SG8_3]|nr:MAG: hypothetical protein AMK69_12600 [Nitrospira bacterium SG8_3]
MQAIAYNYIFDPVGRKMQMERYVKDHEPLLLMRRRGSCKECLLSGFSFRSNVQTDPQGNMD